MGKAAFWRILFASDFHGSTRTWRKLLNAVPIYQAEALIVGGDLTGKAVVPVVRSRGAWSARFLGQAHTLETEQEKRAFEERVADTGFYPYETTEDEMAALASDKAAADAIFDRLMVERLRLWADLAEERLRPSVPIVIIPGNDDPPSVDTVLETSAAFVMAHERVITLFGRFEVLGLGYSNVTPWRAPRDVSEETITGAIDALVPRLSDPRRALFLIHVPPKDTALDECMEIDDNLRPVAGGTSMVHVGSAAVRRAILTYQPLVGLHGHIHESRGVARLGATIAINAGSEYSEGILRAAIVQVREDGKVNHLFVQA